MESAISLFILHYIFGFAELLLVRTKTIKLPPPHSSFQVFFSRIIIRFHPSTIQTLSFLEVTDRKLVGFFSLKILHLKIIPMKMPFCVAVHSHIQVVLSFSYLLLSLSYFEHTVEVARLEQGVKKQDIRFFCIPVLPTEKPICNFYIFWGRQMLIGEIKFLIIPSIVSRFISCTQVTQLHFFFHFMGLDCEINR